MRRKGRVLRGAAAGPNMEMLVTAALKPENPISGRPPFQTPIPPGGGIRHRTLDKEKQRSPFEAKLIDHDCSTLVRPVHSI